MKRKAQGALEYLITYGWAILIIVIIGGALFGLGIFNPSSWVANKRASGFSSVFLKDWKFSSSGAQFVFANQFGSDLDLDSITVSSPTTTFACTNTSASDLPTVKVNDAAVMVVSSCSAVPPRGVSYTVLVQITFTSGGVQHVDSGTLSGKIE